MSGGEGKQREKDPVKPTTKTEGVIVEGRKVHCLSGTKKGGEKISVDDFADGKKSFNILVDLGFIK